MFPPGLQWAGPGGIGKTRGNPGMLPKCSNSTPGHPPPKCSKNAPKMVTSGGRPKAAHHFWSILGAFGGRVAGSAVGAFWEHFGGFPGFLQTSGPPPYNPWKDLDFLGGQSGGDLLKFEFRALFGPRDPQNRIPRPREPRISIRNHQN